MKPDAFLDARGLLCPLPVLKARKKLLQMVAGTTLEVIATDPAAIIDMPHFCLEAGHELISIEDLAEGQRYLIRRGDRSPPS